MRIKFQTWDPESGDEIEAMVPGQYAVCPRCQGTGTHVNPAIDGHGITESEWWGPDWDDESRDAYMTGRYDVTCYDCRGDRVVPDVDWEAWRREDPEAVANHKDTERSLAECDAISAMERAMGA